MADLLAITVIVSKYYLLYIICINIGMNKVAILPICIRLIYRWDTSGKSGRSWEENIRMDFVAM